MNIGEVSRHSTPPAAAGETEPEWKVALESRWPGWVCAGVLLVVFWIVYLRIGLAMAQQDSLHNNAFFSSDIGRVIDDLTEPNAHHGRTQVHPLFVLLFNPIGLGLSHVLHSPINAALYLNSFVGGLSVALTTLFLLSNGLSLLRSILGGLLLGCSASNLYFGSAPETFIFSAVSLIALFACVAFQPGRWRYFLPAGLFSFGVLITNLAMVVIAYASSFFPAKSWKTLVSRVALYSVALLVVAASWANAQRIIFPHTALFYQPGRLKTETRFSILNDPVETLPSRAADLVGHVFAYNFFSPKTLVVRRHAGLPALGLRSSPRFLTTPGRLASGLWLILLGASAWLAVKYQLWRRSLFLALALCIGYNLVLHFVYGDDLFLYSANTCFLLIAWILLSLSEIRVKKIVASCDAVLAVIVAAEIANNYRLAEALMAMHL